MSAFDRDATVPTFCPVHEHYKPCGCVHRIVRPSDVLAALDDPAVQEMVERGVWALAEVENSIPGTRHYRTVRAVIEAVMRPSAEEARRGK